ncbi:MAG: hypothetical protein CMJ50_04425 [Planctomycetaceae bacterium]|nr:hypothetical protein [Planctomycetaceae bacterium]
MPIHCGGVSQALARVAARSKQNMGNWSNIFERATRSLPTNKRAERAFCPAVIASKLSCDNKTEA